MKCAHGLEHQKIITGLGEGMAKKQMTWIFYLCSNSVFYYFKPFLIYI